MNTPLSLLYTEHDFISQVAGRISRLRELLGSNPASYAMQARLFIDFFKNYGDEYHHQKEEQLLFPLIAAANETAGSSIVAELNEHHVEFRHLLRVAEEKITAELFVDAQDQLERYAALLLDHIAVENDECFPMAEELLSPSELTLLAHRFEDCDRELGNSRKETLQQFASAE
jgi:hemerythrin-like domain-containing protein